MHNERSGYGAGHLHALKLVLPSTLTGELSEFDPTRPDFLTLSLDKSDVQEVKVALDSFKALEIDGSEVSSANFHLPTLKGRLDEAAVEIHQGRGLCLIRGLKPTDFSDADNLQIFLGLSSHIGDKRGIQDKNGNVIVHVTDAKTWTTSYSQRHGIHTNASLPMHCDMGADVLALQFRQTARTGGSTYVASSWRIFNELVTNYAGVAETLAEPNWPVQVSGKNNYILAPLISYHDRKLLMCLDPGRLGPQTTTAVMSEKRRGAGSSIPNLTTAQHEALATFDKVATRYRVLIATQPGDILYINNVAVLHGRDSYVDGADGNRRHILRLWLRNSKLCWKIPRSLGTPCDAAFGGRNGVVTEKYAITPPATYEPPRYSSGSAAFVVNDDEDSEV